MQWFAAKTRPHQELKIKNKLDGLGVENFLPMKEQIRVLGEKKRKVMRPLVPRLLFLRCRKELLFALLNDTTLLKSVDPKTGKSIEMAVYKFAVEALKKINDPRGLDELKRRGLDK